MGKRIAGTTLIIMIGFLLTGCGSTDDHNPAVPSAQPSEQEAPMLSLEDACGEFNKLIAGALGETEENESLVLTAADEHLELSKRSPSDISDALATLATAAEDEVLEEEWRVLAGTCHTDAYLQDPSTPWNPVPLDASSDFGSEQNSLSFDLAPVDLENKDGYTGSLSGAITVPEFELRFENAKPGFVDIVRPNPTQTLRFLNTTEQRQAPTQSRLYISLYYSVSAGVCESYARFGDSLTGFGTVAVSPNYCLISLNSVAAGSTGAAVGSIDPNTYIGYTDATILNETFDSNLLTAVPEGEADSILSSLNEPLGVLVTKRDGSYFPQTPICEFPTDFKLVDSGRPLSAERASATVLMAEGPICE